MNEKLEFHHAAHGMGQPVQRFEDPRLLRGEVGSPGTELEFAL